MNHLTPDTLDLYLDDQLDPQARAAADAHLAGCVYCRAELDALRGVCIALERLQPDPIPADLSARVLARIAPPPVPTRQVPRPYVAMLLAAQVALTLLVAIWFGPPSIDWDIGPDALVLPRLAALPLGRLSDLQAMLDLAGQLGALLRPGPLATIPPSQWLYLIVLAGLVVLCQVIFPAVVARTRQNAERMPIRSFVVGLINFLFFGLIAIAFTSRGELARLVGLIILTILLSFVAVGLAAIARLVGERLRPDDAGWLRPLLAGIVTLELAALVPIVGWFMVPTLAGLVGYGATIIALIRRPTTDHRPPRIEDRG